MGYQVNFYTKKAYRIKTPTNMMQLPEPVYLDDAGI
jgi:hypothetical protein